MKKPICIPLLAAALCCALLIWLQLADKFPSEVSFGDKVIKSSSQSRGLGPVIPTAAEPLAEHQVAKLQDSSPVEAIGDTNYGLAVPQVLRASQGGSLGLQMSALPRGIAKLRLDDREVAPENLQGHYQRVLVGQEAEARVELYWPGAGEGRPVFVHAIHGGKIDGKKGGTYYTNGDGQLAFNFETSREFGRYEVLIRSGPSEEVLHFWVPLGAPEVDRYGL